MPKVTTIPPRKQRNHTVTSQKTRKIRVAAYCRVSTDTEEQATSYQAQIAHYEEVIHRNPEWVFAGIYADDGISATSTKHREQFHQMIDESSVYTPLWYAVMDKEDGDNWRNLIKKLLGKAITVDEFVQSAPQYMNFTN